MLRRHASLAVLSAVVLAAGCGGTQIGYGPSQESFDDAEQPVTMVHEPCETSSPGAISIDVDHDGKPEAVRVMDHEREVCRAIHVDGDGKPDAFVYFDPSGGIRRQEADTNGDGRIDSVTSFKNGAATANATDADKNGNADTWELYKDGKVTRRMRDANGNGKVDEWWTWLGKNNGCADVHRDRDGDGKPDLKTEVCQAAAAASAPPR